MNRLIGKGIFILSIAISMISLSSSAHAYGSVTLDPGTTYETQELTGFQTTGSMMSGMEVILTFFDGTDTWTEKADWVTTGPDSGQAGVAGQWYLRQSGDTYGSYNNYWTLWGNDIIGVLIHAGPGNTVFDTTFGGSVGTDGSSTGWTFEQITLPNDLEVNATYSNQVALTGFSPVGDLYLDLQILFPIAYNGTFEFLADTDNIRYAGDINPVSEPSMMALFFSGLAGLAGFGWRFRK
jgi:PEP-CTERM motif